MIRVGKVIHFDKKDNSGVIADYKGKTYLFKKTDCKDEKVPALNTKVTFVRDEDFQFANVALLVMPLEISKAS